MVYEKGGGGNSLINHYFAAKKWVACLQLQKLMVFEMWNDKNVLGEISKNVLKADMNVRNLTLDLFVCSCWNMFSRQRKHLNFIQSTPTIFICPCQHL